MKRAHALVVLGLLAIAGHACAEVAGEVAEEATPMRKLNQFASAQSFAAANAFSHGGSAVATSKAVAIGGGNHGGCHGHHCGGHYKPPVVYVPVHKPKPRIYNYCYWNKHAPRCRPNYRPIYKPKHGHNYGHGFHGGRKMLGYASASAIAISGGHGYHQPYYHQPQVHYYQPRPNYYHGKGHHGKGYGKVHYQPRHYGKRHWVPKPIKKIIKKFQWHKGH